MLFCSPLERSSRSLHRWRLPKSSLAAFFNQEKRRWVLQAGPPAFDRRVRASRGYRQRSEPRDRGFRATAVDVTIRANHVRF